MFTGMYGRTFHSTGKIRLVMMHQTFRKPQFPGNNLLKFGWAQTDHYASACPRYRLATDTDTGDALSESGRLRASGLQLGAGTVDIRMPSGWQAELDAAAKGLHRTHRYGIPLPARGPDERPLSRTARYPRFTSRHGDQPSSKVRYCSVPVRHRGLHVMGWWVALQTKLSG
jgi:hypothetical protein